MAKLNLYKIFTGTTANDKTGTPARSAGQGINENMDKIGNELVRVDDSAEKNINKATDLTAPDHIKYPSVKAVSDAIGSIESNANTYTDNQLTAYQKTADKGAANGYAGLDANSKVPIANTYAANEEIIEGTYIDKTTFNDTSGVAVTPGTAKIYQDTSAGNATSGQQFRWGGTQYAQIVGSPGTTDEVSEGTSNLYFTGARVRAVLLDGLSTVTATAIVAGDSVLAAFGKLQGQINSLTNSLGNKLEKGGYTGTAQALYDFANTKETTTGSQTKADTAEQNAKDYYDANAANIRLSNVAGDLSETEKSEVRGKIGGASNADIAGLDGRVTDLETTYDDLALTWSTGDSKVINVVDSSKVTAVYVNGDRLVKDDEWAVFSATEIEISNTLNDQDKVVVERGRGGVVDAFKEGFYALDIDGFNGKEKFTFYSKRRDSRDIYVGFHVVHQYDMSEAVYADLWRIAGAGDFKYENGVMVDQTRTIMTGAESECAYNSGGDDFVGGYHGDELFTDIKFFADGVQITDLSVDIPLTACSEFSYRQKSTMHQPMKNGVVDANHTIEVIHHKITSFKKGLYTTFNRLIPQYNDVPISLWYHGLSCIGKINGELVANDFLEYETVLGDDLEKLHQVGGRKYYSSHKTNGLSAYAESKLLRPGNKDSGCEMFVWDRVNDTKYYRKFIPSDPIVAGDIWESEMTVKFDKL